MRFDQPYAEVFRESPESVRQNRFSEQMTHASDALMDRFEILESDVPCLVFVDPMSSRHFQVKLPREGPIEYLYREILAPLSGAFRNLKSFLEIRQVFVHLEEACRSSVDAQKFLEDTVGQESELQNEINSLEIKLDEVRGEGMPGSWSEKFEDARRDFESTESEIRGLQIEINSIERGGERAQQLSRLQKLQKKALQRMNTYGALPRLRELKNIQRKVAADLESLRRKRSFQRHIIESAPGNLQERVNTARQQLQVRAEMSLSAGYDWPKILENWPPIQAQWGNSIPGPRAFGVAHELLYVFAPERQSNRKTDMPEENTRILLVCANPRGTDPLRTAEEDRILRESIQLSPKRDRFEVETLNAATIDDLRRALLRKPFDVVHFSGHGTQTGLVFEDTSGKLMVPQSAALADLLQRRKVRVALLNACYSLTVGKIAAIGMDFTVASAGPISDPGAIEFTRGFYDALGAGTDVPDAYAEGISAARLKGYEIDAILLRQGEEYTPKPTQASGITNRDAGSISIRSLLGVAVDTSGSMQDSIRNRSGETLSRFGGVQSALAEVGNQVREELSRRGADAGDSFQVFVYAFGLRIGDGVADMASLWKAATKVDLKREVEVRKQRHEAEARRKSAGYSGLASLARGYGFGGIVDAVTEAAANSIRDSIVGEVSSLVLREAELLGDSTLTAEDLAKLFENSPIDSDERLMEHVLFGLTPMTIAATRIRDRFVRASSDVFDNRSLLVISDGVPTDGDPRGPMREIRDSGVSVIACFVTSDDIATPRVLHGTPLDSWPEGARLMWDISSPIDDSGPAARYLLSHGWSIEPKAKLFVQANHSDVIKEFVQIAGSHFTAETTSVLPRGQ